MLLKSDKVFELLVHNACILDYGLQGIWVQPLMFGNCNAMSAVRHADVFAFGNDPEPDFGKCPDNPFGGEVSKEHFRLVLRLDRQWSLWSPLLSCGDMC